MHASMNFVNIRLCYFHMAYLSIDILLMFVIYIRYMPRCLFTLCIIIASDKTMGMINLQWHLSIPTVAPPSDSDRTITPQPERVHASSARLEGQRYGIDPVGYHHDSQLSLTADRWGLPDGVYNTDHTHSEETRPCEGCHRVQRSPEQAPGTHSCNGWRLYRGIPACQTQPPSASIFTVSVLAQFTEFDFPVVYSSQLYSIVYYCSSFIQSQLQSSF